MKNAFEILPSHDPKSGAVLVRPVKVIFENDAHKAATVEFQCNGLRHVALAKYENLASTLDRLTEKLAARFSNHLPAEKSAIPATAGAGRSETAGARSED